MKINKTDIIVHTIDKEKLNYFNVVTYQIDNNGFLVTAIFDNIQKTDFIPINQIKKISINDDISSRKEEK
jgi:hypothetical protein